MKKEAGIKYLKLKNEIWLHVPQELHIDGDRERSTTVLLLELYKRDEINWDYYEEQLEILFETIIIY